MRRHTPLVVAAMSDAVEIGERASGGGGSDDDDDGAYATIAVASTPASE